MENTKENIQNTLKNELQEAIEHEKVFLANDNGIYQAYKTQKALINALNLNWALECIDEVTATISEIPDLKQKLLKYCDKEATLITPNNNVSFKVKGESLALVGISIPMFGEFGNLMNWEKNEVEQLNIFRKGAMYSLSLKTGIPFKDFIHIADDIKLCNFENMISLNAEQRRNFILDQFLHPESIPNTEAKTFEQIKNSGEEVLLGAWNFSVFFVHNESNEKAMRDYIHGVNTETSISQNEHYETIWEDFIHDESLKMNHHNFIMKSPQSHHEAIYFLTKMTFRKWEKQISHTIKTNSSKLGIPFVNLETLKNEDMLEIDNFEVTLELNNERDILNISTSPKNIIGISNTFAIGINAKILEIISKDDLYELISSSFLMPEETWNLNNSNTWHFNKDEKWFSIKNNKKTNIFEDDGMMVSFEKFKEQIRHN